MGDFRCETHYKKSAKGKTHMLVPPEYVREERLFFCTHDENNSTKIHYQKCIANRACSDKRKDQKKETFIHCKDNVTTESKF